jgi:serine/threonine protein kinase
MSQPTAPPPSTISLNPGDTLAGKYQIERIIGRGSMGIVMAARHIHLDEHVAIKIMLPDAVSQGEHIARFLREARAASRIKNEHVARVMDVDLTQSGMPFIVMEYLEGHDLGAMLEKNGPLGVNDTVDYILEACEALADAHAIGIVHRDFKPANVFLARRHDGRLITKILDFGISKMKAGDVAMTSTVALMGSPAYMSPEQMLSSRDVDARTDIWAVGVTLYQLLSGALPFMGTTVPEVCAHVIHVEPAPLRSLRPEVPPGLESAVMHCMVKDRNQRFQTMADLMAALLPFASGRSVVGSNPGARSAPSYSAASGQPAWIPSAGENTVPVWGGTVNGEHAKRASRRRIIAAGIAVGLAAGAIFATYALRGRPGNETAGKETAPVAASPGESSPPATSVAALNNARRESPPAAPPPEPPAETAAPTAVPGVTAGPAVTAPMPTSFPGWPAGARHNPARPKPASAPKRLPSTEDLFSEPK